MVLLSQNAYAKHRKKLGLPGGTPRAVQVAIETGRLAASVTRDRKIRDAAQADAEWAANTRTAPADLGAARARREEALADMAEIERDELLGKLVKADEVQAAYVAEVTAVKTKLLGVATRAKQRLPELTAAQVRVIDDLVREALEDLGKGAPPPEDEEEDEAA